MYPACKFHLLPRFFRRSEILKPCLHIGTQCIHYLHGLILISTATKNLSQGSNGNMRTHAHSRRESDTKKRTGRITCFPEIGGRSLNSRWLSICLKAAGASDLARSAAGADIVGQQTKVPLLKAMLFSYPLCGQSMCRQLADIDM